MKLSYQIRWGHNRTKTAHGSARRLARRLEAQKRQAVYDALSDVQKAEHRASVRRLWELARK